MAEEPYSIAVSAITVAEMEYGIAKNLWPQKNREALRRFLSPFEILPFTDLDCESYGVVRAYLEQEGLESLPLQPGS